MAKKAKSGGGVAELKAQIKENRLKNIYLFYGEEEYLKEYYIKKIEAMIPDGGLPEYNRIEISGQNDYGVYDDAWQSMPLMTDRRLLLIRDSNIFALRSNKSEGYEIPDEDTKKLWKEKLGNPSDDTVVIFCERNVDARGTLCRAVAKSGLAVNFSFLGPSELRGWISRRVSHAGKKIDPSDADYLASLIDPGLGNLENELKKLIDYCGERITRSDIDRVVSKAVTVRAFDLTDAIKKGDTVRTYRIIEELKTQNESAFSILYLLYSNMEKMLHLKLAGVRSRSDAVEVIGGNPWAAGYCFEDSKSFSTDALMMMVTRVPELDHEIKQGRITEEQALDSYIAMALKNRILERHGTAAGAVRGRNGR